MWETSQSKNTMNRERSITIKEDMDKTIRNGWFTYLPFLLDETEN